LKGFFESFKISDTPLFSKTKNLPIGPFNPWMWPGEKLNDFSGFSSDLEFGF
jgi:hypothetical protein